MGTSDAVTRTHRDHTDDMPLMQRCLVAHQRKQKETSLALPW